MIIKQDSETITYGFDFLTSTVKLDSINRKIFEGENIEYYTNFDVNINKADKEEIHSYFEKHYMDKGMFPTYSNCLVQLVYDFFDIPEDYEIKKYTPIVGGPNSRIHLNAKEGDVFIFKDILMDHGDTYKEGLYTIFRNVKDYYKRDENKERTESFMKKLNQSILEQGNTNNH